MKKLAFMSFLLSWVCILQTSCGPKETSSPPEVEAENLDTSSIHSKWAKPEISFDEVTLGEYELSSEEKMQLKMMLGALNVAIEPLTIEFHDDNTYVMRVNNATVFGGYELKSKNQRLRLRPEGESQRNSIEIKSLSAHNMVWRIQNLQDFLGDEISEMNAYEIADMPAMTITFSR